MQEESYKNRELDEKFGDIKDTLERIEIQTTKTNGRVRFLEKMIYLALGGLAVITFFLPFYIDNKLSAACCEAKTTK